MQIYVDADGFPRAAKDILIRAARRLGLPVVLWPTNLSASDLGYSLLEAGLIQEAESVLKRSVSLAPPEFQYARNNLEIVYERKRNPNGVNNIQAHDE